MLYLCGETNLFIHFALHLPAGWGDDATHAERLCLLADALNVGDRVRKIVFRWTESGHFLQVGEP